MPTLCLRGSRTKPESHHAAIGVCSPSGQADVFISKNSFTIHYRFNETVESHFRARLDVSEPRVERDCSVVAIESIVGESDVEIVAHDLLVAHNGRFLRHQTKRAMLEQGEIVPRPWTVAKVGRCCRRPQRKNHENHVVRPYAANSADARSSALTTRSRLPVFCRY